MQACSKVGGRGGSRPPRFWRISYVTLSRPGGTHYPHQVLPTPRIFDPCCMPGMEKVEKTLQGRRNRFSTDQTDNV